MSTSSHLPLCVYCATARPADESRCPQCGRPWIDVRVGAGGQNPENGRFPAMVGAAASAPAVLAAASAARTVVADPALNPPTVEADETLPPVADDAIPPQPDDDISDEVPPSDPSQRFVWLIPALVAGAAVIVVALFGFGLLDGETDPEAVAAPSVAPTPTTAAPTTTSQAPTTTGAPNTTTTTTIPDPVAIAPVGDAISMSSLTLKAGGIGPVAFNEAASDAVGRLVASLGRPAETGVADETLGLCPGEDGRFVRWAGLTVVVSGTLEDGDFVGYRYEEEAVPIMHLDFATPSGLRLGDPVSALNEIYSTYQIDYLSDGGADLFRLSDADGLLLWGPVSSIEDSGRVEGIHAPDACGSQG